MIVNAVPEGWEVIYQQAHGVLAAELAYYLKPDLQCPHWVATLVAIANHDNRQKTWQGKDGLTPAGAPADFALLPPHPGTGRNPDAGSAFSGEMGYAAHLDAHELPV